MSMNFTKFCQDFNIPYWTSGKNVSPGWINVNCVFCDDPSNHLGWTQDRAKFYCWRCGRHNVVETVALLSGVSRQDAKRLLKEYNMPGTPEPQQAEQQDTRADVCELPEGLHSLHQPDLQLHNHQLIHDRMIEFLEKRRYNPLYLEQTWGVKFTLNTGEYPFRLFLPYYHGGEIVTYQMRDYTGQSDVPYMACPKENAVLDTKETLFGFDFAKNYKNVIVMEGVFDAFRIGPGAVATSGTSWKLAQAKLLAENWQYVAILFDQEPEAQQHAEKLSSMVNSLGTEAEVITLDGCEGYDPDDLSNETANEIKKELLV